MLKLMIRSNLQNNLCPVTARLDSQGHNDEDHNGNTVIVD